MNLREKASGTPEIRRYCDERCHNCYCLLPREDVAEGLHLCRGCRDAKEARSLGLSYGQMMARRRDLALRAEAEFRAKERQRKADLDKLRSELATLRSEAKTPEDLTRLNQQIWELDIERRRLREALGK